ncbi:MAG: polyprenol monophosphomannose synthase [Candidatus Eremiobacteraeota bacterium]|nr:polyprenol monophosphomannose synthase [Candidatus Eremiobacteraeota bacterium]
MVSIVIPCYNEKEGIGDLLKAIFDELRHEQIEGEVVIVDDNSPDGTGDVAEGLKSEFPLQVLHRAGKLGLSSAVMDGFKIAKGSILGVMDADFSHDPKAIPALVKAITEGGAELAVGSRYAPGGGIRNWPLKRRIISRTAILMGAPLTKVRDVTSGYFFLKKEVIEGISLNPIGFKIGLEIFVKGNYKKSVEVPYVFTDRRSGQSKMNSGEVLNYLKQLADLWKYRKKRI